jgi:hypothetical protein
MDEFINSQRSRIRRRIVYCRGIVDSNSPTAPLKARILPKLLRAAIKIELGIYDKCDGCGRSIGHDRLLAIPGAIMCTHCEKQENEDTS